MVIGLCIYLLQIPVPQLIAQPLELMANMTPPFPWSSPACSLPPAAWS